MTYYSCHDFSIYFRHYSTRATTFVNSAIALAGGPRGIRTPDLLNAIETRSQLRYGPGYYFSLYSGPEGIRTPDLLSAIEARSQLRYRPMVTPHANSGDEAKDILLEAGGDVKRHLEAIVADAFEISALCV